MGTSSAARSQERPGDGGSPGACATRRSPRSRRKKARGRSRPQASRTGIATPMRGPRAQPRRGQGGWYRGSAQAALVPPTEAARTTSAGGSTPDEPASRSTARCPPRSTCPRSSTRCSTSGASSKIFATQPRAVRGPPRVGLLRGPADRQRHARRPPHRGPRLQGRLPALQDHAGLPRRPARPAGTATACRSSSRSRRSSASPASRTSRRTASPSSTPSAASR